MVVTVCLGSIKLLHTHWRMRKYSGNDEEERREQRIHRAMSQRTSRSRGHGTNAIPFGIRAIESGIEVDGVWISQDKSPKVLSTDTSIASPSESQIAPIPALKDQFDSNESANNFQYSKPSDAKHADVKSTQKIDNAAQILDQQDHRQLLNRALRRQYPPVSAAKYGFCPYFTVDASSSPAFISPDALYRPFTPLPIEEDVSRRNFSNQPSQGQATTVNISASTCHRPGVKTRTQSLPQSPNDLELLNSHRASQAAETGRLTRRGRPLGQSSSIDLSELVQIPGPSSVSWRALENRPDSGSMATDSIPSASAVSISTAKVAALPPAVRRSSIPDVTPFTEFCKRVSPDARPESLRSSSRNSTQSEVCKSESTYGSAASSPIIPASDGAVELKLPPIQRPSFEKRISQVLRGHGSGFEILKPGSFALGDAARSEHPLQKQRAAPPLSLCNDSRAHPKGGDHRNKLQKKRPPSADSAASSIASRRSRLRVFN